VTQLVLVGEDYYALKIAEAIHADPRCILATIYTDLTRTGTLHAFARSADVSLHDSQILKGSDPATDLAQEADWLINVNSAVILSAEVLRAFELRALNLHNGPLPEYAGRHVHQWAIRNGEETSAATIHHMEDEVDNGPIVATRPFPIRPEDTGLSLYRASFGAGVEAFIEVLNIILMGQALPEIRQDLSQRHLYRHADALDGRIDWSASSRQIVDFIRAGNYRPLTSPSYTAYLEPTIDQPITVPRAVSDNATANDCGSLIDIEETGPRIACTGGSVRIIEAYRGKVRLKYDDWITYFETVPANLLVSKTNDAEPSASS
jgi:methionyl-tRNA formyltransferase